MEQGNIITDNTDENEKVIMRKPKIKQINVEKDKILLKVR
jgi:hypothetical protein